MANVQISPLLKTAEEYRDDLRKAWTDARHGLGEDHIHDLRVATRRMVSALLLLESILGEDGTSKVRRRVKRVMKKLGLLRDIQVQVSIVKKWKTTGSVTRFLKSLERTEKREKDRVADYLGAHRRKRVLQTVKDYERDAAKQLKKIPLKALKVKLERVLAEQRSEVKAARQHFVRTDPRALHELRIASRRLRYSLEATADTIGAAPESELQGLRRRQTQLGRQRDLHLLDAKYAEWRQENGSR
jgi:CHAD domain-containing protein